MRERDPGLRTIFAAALEKNDPDERARYLDEACSGDEALRREVEELLDCHGEAEGFLGGETGDDAALEGPGTRIGPYELVEEIGEGAFGVVYVADQTAPVRRRVALKLVKPGMDTREVLARFEMERQALALMDHPHIARVFDAGATPSGRPYFVMELVRGVSLHEYCDGCHLSLRERLELFVKVCRAVQHAHQKGIIHRDLKPSNVLVARQDGHPAPRVIDFGVAKATGQRLTEHTFHTRFAQMIGTPLYMSPEQAEMTALGVDTRSDIYSLGVLLYELLTGTTPFTQERLRQTRSFDELQRIIREEEPETPSARLCTMDPESSGTAAVVRRTEPRRLVQAVHGDLDRIVMKAIEKDQSQRYETANGLARDVERFLADEPVEARSPSRRYRMRKFVRRHRKGVAVAALVVVCIALSGGTIGWVARDRATRQATLERRIASALEEAESMYREGRVPDAVAALQRAAGLTGGLDDEDMARQVDRRRHDFRMLARLEESRLRSGAVQGNRFRVLDAIPAYEADFRWYGIDVTTADLDEAAARIRDSFVSTELIAALNDWALREDESSPVGERLRALVARADPDPWRRRLRAAAERGDDDALAELARKPDVLAQPPETLVLLAQFLSRDAGGPPRRRAGADIPAAVELLRLAQRRNPDDLRLHYALGRYLLLLERPETAEAVRHHQAVVVLRPDSPGAHLVLGLTLMDHGDLEEAEAEYREALRLKPDYAMAYNNLGIALRRQFRPDEAIEAYEKAMELDPDGCLPHNNLGNIYMDKGEFARAEAEYREALARDAGYGVAHANLGRALAAQDRLDEAMGVLERAREIVPESAKVLLSLAHVTARRGESDEALEILRRVVDSRPSLVGARLELGGLLCDRLKRHAQAAEQFRAAIEIDPDNPVAHRFLATALAHEGNLEGAIRHYEKALEAGPDALAFRGLGKAHRDRGEFAEAVEAYEKSLALAPSADVFSNLANALSAQGKHAEAVEAHRKAIELAPEDAVIRFNLGVTRHAQGEYEAAREAYEKAIELDSEFARAHDGLGYALEAQGKLDEAIGAYGKAAELDPRCYEEFANALAARGRHDEALAAYRKAHAAEPDNPRVLVGWGTLLCEGFQRYEEAEAKLRRAVELDRNSALALCNLGVALERQGDPRAAAAAYERAAAADPEFVLAFLNLGYIRAQLGRFDKAAEAYRAALSLRPRLVRALRGLGDALHRQGKLEKAVEVYDRLLAIRPKEAGILSDRGLALVGLSRFDDALASYRKALAIDPDSVDGRINLAALLCDHLHRYEEAEEQARKAVAIRPDEANAHYNLGAALEAQGEIGEAMASFAKYVELKPRNAFTLNKLAWMLATTPERRLRDTTRALELAARAAVLAPGQGSVYNTLGVARFRAGDHDGAVAALRKSMDLRAGGDAVDWFFVAMAHARLGQREEAREWYAKAAAWTDAHAPDSAALRRFRGEARRVLGLEPE